MAAVGGILDGDLPISVIIYVHCVVHPVVVSNLVYLNVIVFFRNFQVIVVGC
jgi:hypothetical protein